MSKLDNKKRKFNDCESGVADGSNENSVVTADDDETVLISIPVDDENCNKVNPVGSLVSSTTDLSKEADKPSATTAIKGNKKAVANQHITTTELLMNQKTSDCDKKKILRSFDWATLTAGKKSAETLVKDRVVLWFCNFISKTANENDKELVILILMSLNRCFCYYTKFDELMSTLNWEEMMLSLKELISHEDFLVNFYAAWTVHTIVIAKNTQYRDFAVRRRFIPLISKLCLSTIHFTSDKDISVNGAKTVHLLELLATSAFLSEDDIQYVVEASLMILTSDVMMQDVHFHACGCVYVMLAKDIDEEVFTAAKECGLIGSFVLLLNYTDSKKPRGFHNVRQKILECLHKFAASKCPNVRASFVTMSTELALMPTLHLTTINRNINSNTDIRMWTCDLFTVVADCYMESSEQPDVANKFWVMSREFIFVLTSTLNHRNNAMRKDGSGSYMKLFTTVCYIAKYVVNVAEVEILSGTYFFEALSKIMVSRELETMVTEKRDLVIKLILQCFTVAFNIVVDNAQNIEEADHLYACVSAETWQKFVCVCKTNAQHRSDVTALIKLKNIVKTKFHL